ncbi:hypothetical protein D3C74_218350 [compost metagenome]
MYDRLNEVKKQHELSELHDRDIDWLIEQAEKSKRYEQALEEIANEGHSFVGEISKFCINTARVALGKQKLS